MKKTRSRILTEKYRSNYGTTCKHCRTRLINRPRGLCWTCYYTPGVRGQYPEVSKFGRRGVTHHGGVLPLPTPTNHPPGTVGKLEVLATRAAAGEQLWHPLDAVFAGDPQSLAAIANVDPECN